MTDAIETHGLAKRFGDTRALDGRAACPRFPSTRRVRLKPHGAERIVRLSPTLAVSIACR
ncbi:hypothetical protein BH24GEM1_BH24GEM1_20800 [soil metagenome]